MILKGKRVKKSSTIVFRNAIEGEDKNYRLKDYSPGDICFVNISDCLCYEKDGFIYYETDNTPALPVAHGATYYAYGPWRKATSRFGEYIDVDGETLILKEWMECTMYFAHKRDVYTCKLKQKLDEERVKECSDYLKEYKKYISSKYNKNTFYLNIYSVKDIESKEKEYLKSFRCVDKESLINALKEMVEISDKHDICSIYKSDYTAMRKFNYEPIMEIKDNKYQIFDRYIENEDDISSDIDYDYIAELLLAAIK